MTRLVLIFFVLILFTECANKVEEGKISLYNDYHIELLDGEKIIEIDEEIKEKYLDVRSNSESVIPLYRYIKGDGYYIYVGLPYRERLTSLNIDALSRNIENITLSDSSIYFSYENNLLFYEYGKSLGDNMVYFTCQADLDTKSSIFSEEELNKRIVKEPN